MPTDLLVPEYRLRQHVTSGDIADTALAWYIVVLGPSRHLEPVRVVVHAAAFQLHTRDC